MKNYICKKALSIEMFDGNGFSVEEILDIQKGEKFQSSDDRFRCVGGPDTVRLDSDDGTWVEISRETLNEHFEETPKE